MDQEQVYAVLRKTRGTLQRYYDKACEEEAAARGRKVAFLNALSILDENVRLVAGDF